MANTDIQQDLAYLIADFNNRLVDLEERNRIIRERVVLLGNNLISIRDELSKDIEILKKQNIDLKQELEKLTLLNQNILSEINSFVKKNEIAIIERMLRDFQPLEFARIKDVQDMLRKNKDIKTQKSE